ncbi:hypothetical protein [Companilactobacillus mishanensis]|uniref:Surface layer protein A domain-containing protein n=1 Tax=Companilactobacillus mishanensis TaxID=2486008 RepID=A0ABW9P6E1_9LACO|nr:hypothetical protein [Companilactobacillus mishanensis]MQS44731.1 hypothetical protein [Companilactobacillus mishanensis]MQS89839.1 hypothetical protein [Companilactobacillus mishanensis]
MKKWMMLAVAAVALVTLEETTTVSAATMTIVDKMAPDYTEIVPYDSNIREPNYAGISTVYTKNALTTIYDSNGKPYETIHLAPKTAWHTDKIFTQNSNSSNSSAFTQYFRVSTNGFVKDSDITIVNPDGTSVLKMNEFGEGEAYNNFIWGSGRNYNIVPLQAGTTWKIINVKHIHYRIRLDNRDFKRTDYLLQIGNNVYYSVLQSSGKFTIE